MIPHPCGQPGQPACPPIECIVTKEDGKQYITINGLEYELAPVPVTSSEGIESNTAQDTPETSA